MRNLGTIHDIGVYAIHENLTFIHIELIDIYISNILSIGTRQTDE